MIGLPAAAATTLNSEDARIKTEHLELQRKLKGETLQREMLTTMFMDKEDAYQRKIAELEAQLLAKSTEPAVPPSTEVPPEAVSLIQRRDTEMLQTDQGQSSADPRGLFREYDQEMTKLQKMYRKWEKRVMKCGKIKYMKHGEATRAYHLQTLPLPLMKVEEERYAEQYKPKCAEEEMGGYEEITQQEWEARAIMPNQPRWRLEWFKNHPTTKNTYALAPRDLRTNPTFCPIRRRRTWESFERQKARHPSYLNYPLLPNPPHDIATEAWFIQTLTETIKQFEGIPDLACQMLIKIADMILTSVQEFHKAIEHQATWRNFLEGRQGLTYNLQEHPPIEFLMGLYSRVQFCKAHHMVTFEEAFLTGFFEYDTKIFGPNTSALGAQYIAYHNLAIKNPVGRLLQDAETARKAKEWKAAMQLKDLEQASSSEDEIF